MSVVGIDFGTKSCVVAVAQRGVINIATNEVSHRSTPSIVGYGRAERHIGESGLSKFKSNLKNTVDNIKRLIGRNHSMPEAKDEFSSFYGKILRADDDAIVFQLQTADGSHQLRTEQVAAALFAKLRDIAQSSLSGQKVVDCVISCPPFFTQMERVAIVDAARIAGLNVLRLMNESAAVALAYGILRPLPEDKTIKNAFVDIGHSATTVSIVAFKKGELRVLGTASDRHLGGRDIDQTIVKHCIKEISQKYGLDTYENKKALWRLSNTVEKSIKKVLTTGVPSAGLDLEVFMEDTDIHCELNKEQFDQIVEHLLPRLSSVCQRALEASGTTADEIASVECIGGGIRIPRLQAAISEAFGRPLSFTLNGDESVARGCALQCAMLSPNFRVREFQVHDVSPYEIQVAWGPVQADLAAWQPEEKSVLYKANNPIPSIKMISFQKQEPFQFVIGYAHPQQLPPGTPELIGRWVVDVPAEAAAEAAREAQAAAAQSQGDDAITPKPPKVKVQIQLDIHGCVQMRSARLVSERIEMVPVTPKQEKMDTSADAAAASTPKKEDETPSAAASGSEDAEMSPASGSETPAEKPEEPAAPAEPQMKPKKKTVKSDIPFQAFSVAGLSEDDIKRYGEIETRFQAKDREVVETAEMKNALESYVYDMRNKLGNELAEFFPPSVKDPFRAELNKTEDWMYDEGLNQPKSVYAERLQALRATGEPAVRRRWEFENREPAIAALKTAVVMFQVFVSEAKEGSEKYAHLSPEEVEKVAKAADDMDRWLDDTIGQLKSKPTFEDPVATIAQLQAKQKELQAECFPVMNKKPPPPPKKEEPKPTDEAGEQATPKEDAAEQPAAMDDKPEESTQAEEAPAGTETIEEMDES